MSLKIAICCCTYLFGEGIKNLIEQNGLGEVTVINCSNCSAPKEVIKEKPDLLIIDFNTLSCIFFDTIFEHEVAILLLGTGCLPKIENKRLINFASKGLVGILSPTSNSSDFIKATKCVASGEHWFHRKKVRDILSNIKNLKNEITPSLTKREIEIIKLICKGYHNKDIMQSLNISEPSVKKHLNAIYKKVGVSDRLQLAIYAFNHLPNIMI